LFAGFVTPGMSPMRLRQLIDPRELKLATGGKRFDRICACLLQSGRSSLTDQTARYCNVPKCKKPGMAWLFSSIVLDAMSACSSVITRRLALLPRRPDDQPVQRKP